MACQSTVFVRTPVAIALTMGLIGTAGIAQANDVYELGEVVVTASRTAQSTDETLAPVSVITRDDIEKKQATSLSELLKSVPGLNVSTKGGAGSDTSVFIRGASSSQTLVLLDGQRINSATLGTTGFQYLNPDQIERIEIVRGPRSSLYGADAIGGVVQIFTRKGKGEPFFTVKAGTGSRNTNELGLNFAGESEGTQFSLGVNLFETGGYDATNDNYSNNEGYNKDDDAFRNKSLSANLSHEFENGLEAGMSVSHNQGKNEYDGYTTDSAYKKYPYSPYAEFKTSTLNTFIIKDISNLWFTRVDLGYSNSKTDNRGENDSSLAPYSPTMFETSRISALWQNDISWLDAQILTVGLDFYNDNIDSSTTYTDPAKDSVEDSRYNMAVFLQNQTEFDSSDLLIGLRTDKNEAYGTNTTGNIAWGFELPKAMRLVASYGAGFRAPTFNDLYYPEDAWKYVGNPDVQPEKSQNYELELSGKHKVAGWSVSIFQNDIEDMILWEPNHAGGYQPTNVQSARVRGIEAIVSNQFKGWDINTSITLLDPMDTNKDRLLTRRPKQTIAVDVDRSFSLFTLGGTFRAQSCSNEYTFSGDTINLSGFGTVDLRAGYQFTKEFKTELKVTNVLDKEYQTANGYNGEPRGTFVTFIWSPKL
ncbi:hypothetical protein ACH42_13095 [Endozoicomonas sp. (ex Bugula neritina AB1)]|nr:hypothetical protein ACH42_13095 [Endozoicomonas sp. (ex Bugula neritina AB1)]